MFAAEADLKSAAEVICYCSKLRTDAHCCLGVLRDLGAPATHVAADLLLVAAAREVADPYSRPTQLRHQLRQTPVRACCAAALGHLKHVQQRLTAHALQTIKLNLAADTLQR